MAKKTYSKGRKRKESEVKSKPSYLFYFYFAFLTIVFPIVHYSKALDTALMPRLFALSLFVAVFGLLFYFQIKKYRLTFSILKDKVFILMIAFVLLSIISLILSSNPIEGLLDIIRLSLMIFIIFWTVVMVTYEPDGLEKMLKFLTITGLILSVVAFWQYFTYVFQSKERFFEEYGRQTPIIYQVRGLMAHKNLLSFALGLILPFTIFGTIKLQKNWKKLAIVVTTVILLLLVILQTRAIWVGSFAAIAVVILTMLFLGKHLGISKKWRISFAAIGVIGFLGIASILFLSQRNSNNQYIKQLQSIVNPTSKQNIHRINIWKTTLDMIPEKPILGYGPGNWKLHAPKFYNGRFTNEEELNWQRPHNDFLWVMTEKGLLGFAIYMSVFVMIFYYLFRTIRRSENREDRLFALFLIGALTMYLTASFFDFPYERVFHTTFLGILFATVIILNNKLKSVNNDDKIIKPAFILLPIAIGIFGAIYAAQCIDQEVHLIAARKNFNYVYNMANLGRQLPAQEANRRWRIVLEESQKAQKPLKNMDPQANPIYSYEGIAYMNLGDYVNGVKVLEMARQQHPGNIFILNNLGAAYFHLENFDKAREYLERSYKIFPSRDCVINLSAVYYKLGMYDEAYEIIQAFPEEKRTGKMLKNLKALETIFENQGQEPEAINN